jgi:hypothetical protein
MITVPAIAIKKRTNNIPNNRSITPEHQKKNQHTFTIIHWVFLTQLMLTSRVLR